MGQKVIIYVEDKTKKIMTLVTDIIVTSAIAIYFDFSPLIANMVAGFTYRNFARKNLGIEEYLDTVTQQSMPYFPF